MKKNIVQKIGMIMAFSAVTMTVAAATPGTADGVPENGNIRPVDVTPLMREELAEQIAAHTAVIREREAKKAAASVITDKGTHTTTQMTLDLPKTVRLALAYNRDLKASRYAVKKAEAAIGEAKAARSITGEYTFSAGRGSAVTAMGTMTGNQYNHELTVSLPLYTGGRIEHGIALAELGKEAAQEDLLKSEQNTKLEAVKGYFSLLAAREVQRVYKEAVANLQAHVQNVKAQYTVGTVAKVDVLHSEVSLAAAKTRAVGADNEAALAEDNLDNILGLPLTTALTLQDHRLPFQAYTLSLQESTQYALTYRPEVLQAALAVQKAATYMALAKADNRPTAGIRFTQAWNDTAFPGTKHKTWSLGGQISYRFYDGGAGKHKISQARQELNIAGEIEQKTRDGVQLQVKQAYLAVRSAAQRVRETQAAVTQAAEGFAISRVRYEAGVGINLDVLDAQLALNQAKINHIQALYDYNVGISSLEQAMGMDVRSGVVRP